MFEAFRFHDLLHQTPFANNYDRVSNFHAENAIACKSVCCSLVQGERSCLTHARQSLEQVSTVGCRTMQGCGKRQIRQDFDMRKRERLQRPSAGPMPPVPFSLHRGWDQNCAVVFTRGVKSLKCWGNGNNGKNGYGNTDRIGDGPGEMGANLPFVDLGGKQPVSVGCGGPFCCAVLDGGAGRAVSCWGGNYRGLLGDGSGQNIGDEPMEMGMHLPTVDLGTGAFALEVFASLFQVCVLLRGGAVKCWGRGYALGLGDTCVAQL